jgi:hypothetical protein
VGDDLCKIGQRRPHRQIRAHASDGHPRVVVTSFKTAGCQRPAGPCRPVEEHERVLAGTLGVYGRLSLTILVFKMTLSARAPGLAFGRTRHPAAG